MTLSPLNSSSLEQLALKGLTAFFSKRENTDSAPFSTDVFGYIRKTLRHSAKLWSKFHRKSILMTGK